jgi:hypothetical protein
MIALLLSWPGGSLESTLKLAALILLSYALVLWLSAVVWVYRDVKKRTDDAGSQAVAVLLVAIFNVPGLIVYLVIRPQDTLADNYERSLEAESILHELQLTTNSCQTCRRPIDDDFNVCPHCRTILREPCRACGRAIRTSWVTCPYCATERVLPERVAPRPSPAAGLGAADTEPISRPRRARFDPAETVASQEPAPAGQLPPRRRQQPS